jgi:SAM-dependent methyltransferase
MKPLPSRYATQWRIPFLERVERYLTPGMTILDLGGGALPALPLGRRPSGTTYVGLDVSRAELERAPRGTYDEMHELDAATFDPALAGRFDLVLSWQVLEHVASFEDTIENCRAYLKPEGALVAQFSGTFTFFGLLNRALPHRVSVTLLHHLNGRPRGSIFPAHYDRCWHSAIVGTFARWGRVEVAPLYHGAEYVRFSSKLQRAYLVYENWAFRRQILNLATHYIVMAER